MTEDRSARPWGESATRLEHHGNTIVFPREPLWWRSNPTKRHRAVLTNFDPADISIIVDDLVTRRADPVRTVESVTSLLRRQWALSWLAEVSRRSLQANPSLSPLEHHLRIWQARGADLLAEATWADIVRVAPHASNNAVRLAMLEPAETYDR